MKRVCFIGGSCLLLCHMRLKWILGRRCHITDKIQQLVIVTVSQCTVWKKVEFGTDAPIKCASTWHRAVCRHPLLGSPIPSFSRKDFCTIPLCYKAIDPAGMGKLTWSFPGKRTLCIGQWNSLPRSLQRLGVGGKLGAPSCTGKAKPFHCYLASLLLCESLGLADKTGYQHHTSLFSSCRTLALLQNLLENRDCWKPQGFSGDPAALWAFLLLCLKGLFLPQAVVLHFTYGLGNTRRNRKAEYWTNVHLSEYKTPLLPTVYCISFFLIVIGFYVAVKVI